MSNSLAAGLRAAGIEDVRDDTTTRAAYSTDASLYRVVPRAVAFPRTEDDVLAAVAFARENGVPITPRGAGTSVAGNSIGPGIVLEFGRYMNRVLSLDPATRSARVQPGTVQARLQQAALPHGLRFGPDPSTHNRCTIGGMIGNDACGSRSLGYGRTADNVRALRMVTGTGELLVTGSDAHGFETGIADLTRLVDAHLAPVRTELGRFGRQISGYALHPMLPENDRNLTRTLVGTEGTLGVLTEATVSLVVEPAVRVMVALGYEDIASAGDDAPAVLTHAPTACEGLDSRIVDVVRERVGAAAVPDLPKGRAWLLVEVSGDDRAEVMARAHDVARTAAAVDARIIADPAEAAVIWKIREDGAGLAGRAPSGRPAWPGWEDAAVPPASLGAYLRRFDALLTDFGLTAMPFGHFGDGCMHVRLDYPLSSPGGSSVFREFLLAAAGLVGEFGGSLSGEHGDGRARSELLPAMYSPEVLALFGAVKHVFDPLDVLNPGILVDPAPLDADLRVPAAQAAPALRRPLALAYASDGGDFSQAVHRCTGVGKCRSVAQGPGTVMCPSYAATGEEKDSTRGRARLLQELANGTLVDGWRHPALHDALDLCLSCKGCASDCPTSIDMASYKAEVTYQAYKGRLRPRSHYVLGRLPSWARLASFAPRLANATTSAPGLRRIALAGAGVDRRRSVPKFARRTFRRGFRSSGTGPKPVVVFVDSFSNHFSPEVAEATVAVLRAAGYAVEVTTDDACCGLTWISTGQLDAARTKVARTVAELLPAARAGVPVVGIEPSCTAVLRHDAVELLGTEESRVVAGAVRTLAELLDGDPDWRPPSLAGTTVVAQPHCHHHAVMGWGADARLLERCGATVRRVGGCCGLAGNFGVEQGHYEVSVAVAELQLLPALDAAPDAVLLADGFSCRTQAADLRGRDGVHLAQLLVSAAGA